MSAENAKRMITLLDTHYVFCRENPRVMDAYIQVINVQITVTDWLEIFEQEMRKDKRHGNTGN